jgi:hypothetical protein
MSDESEKKSVEEVIVVGEILTDTPFAAVDVVGYTYFALCVEALNQDRLKYSQKDDTFTLLAEDSKEIPQGDNAKYKMGRETAGRLCQRISAIIVKDDEGIDKIPRDARYVIEQLNNKLLLKYFDKTSYYRAALTN